MLRFASLVPLCCCFTPNFLETFDYLFFPDYPEEQIFKRDIIYFSIDEGSSTCSSLSNEHQLLPHRVLSGMPLEKSCKDYVDLPTRNLRNSIQIVAVLL